MKMNVQKIVILTYKNLKEVKRESENFTADRRIKYLGVTITTIKMKKENEAALKEIKKKKNLTPGNTVYKQRTRFRTQQIFVEAVFRYFMTVIIVAKVETIEEAVKHDPIAKGSRQILDLHSKNNILLMYRKVTGRLLAEISEETYS